MGWRVLVVVAGTKQVQWSGTKQVQWSGRRCSCAAAVPLPLGPRPSRAHAAALPHPDAFADAPLHRLSATANELQVLRHQAAVPATRWPVGAHRPSGLAALAGLTHAGSLLRYFM